MFKCIIIHHNYCMVVKLYFEITLSNLHLSMHYYYYILSALNSIFYINFILVLYIIFLLFIFILISIYLWPVLYLMTLCGACCRLHKHQNKWNENEIFKIQKRKVRIIMNSSKNASCRQLFKELNILPIQYFYLLLKIKTNFCLTHKYIKSIQGKLPICIYLQQTCQHTKRVFITQEIRSTIISQQLLKIYLMIRINSN